MADTTLERAFTRVLWLLRDYLADLVVIGGWVPFLYARCSGDPWSGGHSRTAEVDILTMPPLPVHGAPLDETLRAAGLAPAREGGPSAVWNAAAESGEQIEFLTPHRGIGTTVGTTVHIPGHGQVGAISLSTLELLGQHITTLTVPVGDFDGTLHEVSVRVPRLGVYVVHKAATYTARRAHIERPNPKQAKDLVYLHDVMAASDVVRQRVETDLRALWQSGKTKAGTERQTIRTALNNLSRLVGAGRHAPLVSAAAAELSERDRITRVDAEARLLGQLTDLVEIVKNVAAQHRGPDVRRRMPPPEPEPGA